MDKDELQCLIYIQDRILRTLRAVAREEQFPSRSAGEMDDFIKKGRQEITALRQIHHDMERVFTGSLEIGE